MPEDEVAAQFSRTGIGASSEERIRHSVWAGVAEVISAVESAHADSMAAILPHLSAITVALQRILNAVAGYGPAVAIQLQVGGSAMGDVTLSVDVQGEKVHADWVDDKGDLTTDYPAGAAIAFTSSNGDIVEVGPAVVDAAKSGCDAPLTFKKSGFVTLSAAALDDKNLPLPGFAVATVNLTVTPGPAAGLLVSVAGETPQPAPSTGA